MRDLKFRAWDVKQKKWANLNAPEMSFSPVGELTVGETIEHGTHDEFNPFILMQYTGLRDTNGVEIYDGDVVEMLDGIFEVEWNDDTCGWQYSDGCPLNGDAKYGVWKTVRGNIHENPELMEPK